MQKIIFSTEIKSEHGSKENKKLRKENKIPAILYGKKESNVALKIENKTFLQAYEDLEKSEIFLKIKEKIQKVKIQNIQKHPAKGKILHIDFLRL